VGLAHHTVLPAPGDAALNLDGNSRLARGERVTYADDPVGDQVLLQCQRHAPRTDLTHLEVVALVGVPLGVVTQVLPVVPPVGTMAEISVAEFTS
jgi:hypothetical protein